VIIWCKIVIHREFCFPFLNDLGGKKGESQTLRLKLSCHKRTILYVFYFLDRESKNIKTTWNLKDAHNRGFFHTSLCQYKLIPRVTHKAITRDFFTGGYLVLEEMVHASNLSRCMLSYSGIRVESYVTFFFGLETREFWYFCGWWKGEITRYLLLQSGLFVICFI